MMMVLEGLILDYWLICICKVTTIEWQIAVCLSLHMVIQAILAYGQWPTQLMQSCCIVIIVSIDITVFCV